MEDETTKQPDEDEVEAQRRRLTAEEPGGHYSRQETPDEDEVEGHVRPRVANPPQPERPR